MNEKGLGCHSRLVPNPSHPNYFFDACYHYTNFERETDYKQSSLLVENMMGFFSIKELFTKYNNPLFPSSVIYSTCSLHKIMVLQTLS